MTDASLQPHWMPDVQAFAIQQERDRHLDTIFSYGECSIFALMWRVQDFEQGLVAHCSTCWGEPKTAAAFGQAKRANCPDCYGTTFEGGYRAIITRPALWDHDAAEQHEAPRGDTFQSDARVQTADDFAINTDDYVFRRDGTRWQVRKIDWELLRTGFAFPGRPETSVGWNLTSVDLEDETSVAYKLPPDPEQVIDLLAHAVGDHFSGCVGYEDIRAPLNPGVVEARTITDEAPAIDSVTAHRVLHRVGVASAGAVDVVHSSAVRVRAAADVGGAADAGAGVVVPGTPPINWVASGYFNGALVSTSPDGVTWTPGTTPLDNMGIFCFCAATNGSYWLIGSTHGLLRSNDGTTWFQVSSPFDDLGPGTAYTIGLGWNGSMWVAVGHTTGAQAVLATSADGTTWTAHNSFPNVGGGSADGDCVAWNGSLWVIGGRGWDGFNTPAIMTSPDGATWTARSTPIDTPGNSAIAGQVLGIAYNGSLFVAVCSANNGTTMMTSPDGINWIARSTPMDGVGAGGDGVAWGGGKWVAVGHSPSGGMVMTSPDGINWTARSTPFDGYSGTVSNVAWNGSLWVAVNQNQSPTKIATSPDGITWTARNAGPPFILGVGIASKPETVFP